MKARLAMTVGDPRGIGPEIVAKALADPRVGERCDVVVVGPEGTVAPVGDSVGRWLPESDMPLAGKLSGLAITRAVGLAHQFLRARQAAQRQRSVGSPLERGAEELGGALRTAEL